MGIGPARYNHYGYQKVDFLPPICDYMYIISQRKPGEIASFETLINPFDKYVWAFTLASTISVMAALTIMKRCWNLKQGRPSYENNYYKGEKQHNYFLLGCSISIFRYHTNFECIGKERSFIRARCSQARFSVQKISNTSVDALWICDIIRV